MAWRAEAAEVYSGGSGKYTKREIKLAVKDAKTWIHAVIQIMVVTILYGMFPFVTVLITA
jgi:hypoxanthine-guanine phosphoribosyltransferase